MHTEELISADEFCFHHDIEQSFIYALNESGLISIVTKEEKIFIPAEQLASLEKLVRMHYTLGINIEGLETISPLLQRMDDLHRKIVHLSNRLRQYES